MQEPNAFDVATFCQSYGVGRSLAYKEMSAGRLAYRKAGKRTLILKTDADAWVNALPIGRANDAGNAND